MPPVAVLAHGHPPGQAKPGLPQVAPARGPVKPALPEAVQPPDPRRLNPQAGAAPPLQAVVLLPVGALSVAAPAAARVRLVLGDHPVAVAAVEEAVGEEAEEAVEEAEEAEAADESYRKC